VLGNIVNLKMDVDPFQYEPIEPHISAEELQRRRQEPDFSTAEVLAYLETL
jgi:hypothetical protein